MNNESLNILGQLKLVETRGYSAYEVAVLNGYTGTEEEWLASLVGAKGDKGEQGEPGEPGVSPDMSNYYTKSEIDELLSNIPSGGGNSDDIFRVDIEYGESTGYEYVLATDWSDIQTFLTNVNNHTNTKTAVLYINNQYMSNIWRNEGYLGFIAFETGGSGSNLTLYANNYEIRENGIDIFYYIVPMEED